MKVPLFAADGSPRGETDLAGIPVFEGERGLQAVKEVVVAQAANARQGTRQAKTRGEVSGGGKKPWRQKGTGRARHGSTRSPIWAGGGVVFGPRPRDFSKKINRKVKDLALRRAFFDRVSDGSIAIVESLAAAEGKTRSLAALVRAVAPEGTVLLVDVAYDPLVTRAARNLARVERQLASDLNPTDLCRYDRFVITAAALAAVRARLGDEVSGEGETR